MAIKIPLTIILFLSISITCFSQNRLRLNPKDVAKMSLVEVQSGPRSFPKAALYKVEEDKLIVLKDFSNLSSESIFISKEVSFNNIDQIVVYSKKRKTKLRLISGLALGTVAWLGTELLNSNRQKQFDSNIGISANNTLDPMISAGVGFGVGFLIGDLFHSKKISVKNRNASEVYTDLSPYSYR